MLGSKEIDMINNSDTYKTSQDLYLSEKEREGKQSADVLKARVGGKKADGTAISYNPRKYNQEHLLNVLQYL